MRRADRLFQIIQVLRRSRNPLTADAIALELETSKRTIYRDIATLMGQRVPIRGEAGMGYILEKGFDLPPLMLTPDEIEAAVLGAQWVVSKADGVLARAASHSSPEPAARRVPVWVFAGLAALVLVVIALAMMRRKEPVPAAAIPRACTHCSPRRQKKIWSGASRESKDARVFCTACSDWWIATRLRFAESPRSPRHRPIHSRDPQLHPLLQHPASDPGLRKAATDDCRRGQCYSR